MVRNAPSDLVGRLRHKLLGRMGQYPTPTMPSLRISPLRLPLPCRAHDGYDEDEYGRELHRSIKKIRAKCRSFRAITNAEPHHDELNRSDQDATHDDNEYDLKITYVRHTRSIRGMCVVPHAH